MTRGAARLLRGPEERRATSLELFLDLVFVILGGPALFLAGRAIFEYTVFNRVSRDRVIGILVLAAISPLMIFLPPVLVAAAAALVLAGIAVSDAACARRRPPEPPSPPG